MIADYSPKTLTMPEQDVEKALAAYKMALINTNYRNWWHRVLYRLGNKEVIRAANNLETIKEHAKRVVNSTSDHKAACRVISARQREKVRNADQFLSLIE